MTQILKTLKFVGAGLLAATLTITAPNAHADAPLRPELPNPQFARADWINLNGAWDYAWDDRNQGLQAGWQNKTSGFPMTIQVPFAYESLLSGVHDESDHEFSWYHRQFTVPGAWVGQHVLLHFGAVHYQSQVWINGKNAGGHTGGQTPFSFDITPFLHAGQNDVSLRIDHRQHDLLIARGKQMSGSAPEGIFYTRTSGIWQTVWLEHAGPRYVDAFQIHSTVEGRIRADVNLNAPPAPGDYLEISVQDPATLEWIKVGSTLTTDASSVNFTLLQPKLWSPDAPNLYQTRITVSDVDGDTLDQVDTYFGIREIDNVDGKLQLNGKPLYLKFVLDQGYWPDSMLTPPSDQALQDDINLTKQMGFNGVRKHQKLEDPRFLYWADQKGLLVSSEFASPLQYSHGSALQFAQEWREAIGRDVNHPSIIIWVSANESWGFPQLDQANQLDDMVTLYDLTKKLDPSRLAIDNDGWEHSSRTDLFALHDYAHTGPDMRKNFDTFDPDQQPPIVIARASPSMVAGQVYNGSPLYVSEMAGIGYIAPGDVVPANAWGYDGLEANTTDVLARLTSLYAAMRDEKPMIGFCLTQLTDVEQEVNGLLTFHRVPKLNPADVARLNATLP